MPGRAFLLLLIGLIILNILTSPPLVGPLLQRQPSPTATVLPPTPAPTFTATLDPFAGVPTATPVSGRTGAILYSLPTPALGVLPPTFTPVPASRPERREHP